MVFPFPPYLGELFVLSTGLFPIITFETFSLGHPGGFWAGGGERGRENYFIFFLNCGSHFS